MKKLLIFDGNSILNRAFYGIKMLSNSKGVYTNGIYGFLNIFFKFTAEEKPDYVCVAFDLRAKTFRHNMYDGYKANRKGMPDELASQMPYLKDILDKMNVKRLELEGFEADDIIGTVAARCENEGVLCSIITGDRDDLQLASDTTVVRLVVTRGGNTETTDYDGKAVFDTYGVTPSEFIDVKALMGDTSDNIPGVAGIGEKTAFELIKEYKSLNAVYENISGIKGSRGTKLEAGRDMAYLSYELAKINREIPLEFKTEEAAVKAPDDTALAEILSELELKSILAKLNIKAETGKALDAVRKSIQPESILDYAPKEGDFCYLLTWQEGFLAKLSFCVGNTVYSADFLTEFDVQFALPALKEIFEGDILRKISHGIKKDIVKLKENLDIDFAGDVFDTEICGYIEQPSRSEYSLETLAADYLSLSAPQELAAALLPLLEEKLSERIRENGQEYLLYEVELPLIRVLASMELEGFKVDKNRLAEFSEMLGKRIAALEAQIFECAGEEFNINSPKQLGVILFEKLGLPAVKKTKTGYSTNAEVLEKLEDKHPIIGCIMEYRTLTKLKSTYADGLYGVINPKTLKINSSFNQTVTTTGRISSTEPNLQNIPVRTELGREIRKMFISSNGVLVDADYSQIELRVLAHISGDENMTEAFKSDADIHASTAAAVFGVSLDEVTGEMRSKAKAVNFGIVYGIGDFSLAKDIGTTRKAAAEYIAEYFKRYPNIKKYIDETVENAKKNGFVSTLAGRRRYIPELKSSNFNLRSFGERVAMNSPIQGYAADIIKIAMVKVYARLKKEGLKSKLILQVHDELIIDAFEDEAERATQILKEEMEGAVALNVPLIAETKVGYSWFDTK